MDSEENIIIDNTDKSFDDFGHCYGSVEIIITKEDLEALQNGKAIANTINYNEYTIFVSLVKDK